MAAAPPMTRPSTAMMTRSGSTWSRPSRACRPTVTRPAAIIDSVARRERDAGGRQHLLEPLGGHQALDGVESGEAPSVAVASKSGSVDRLAALLGESRRDIDIERRQLLEAREPEALEEIEPGAVQERAARRRRAAELDDEPSVEQRADRVVGVDAADPLDRQPS